MREADTVMLASLHRVREVAGRHLTEGPLPVDVLAALVADGVELGADPADRVLEALDASTAFVELAGERWCWVPSIADGVTWTTVLDPDDADHDVLPVEDLPVLGWWVIDRPVALPDGRPVHDDDNGEAVIGPDGWLAGRAGPIAVRLDGGVLRVDRLPAVPVPAPAQVAAVAAAFAALAETSSVGGLRNLGTTPVELTTAPTEEIVWESLAANVSVFAASPVAPLDDLLAAAGLERHGSVVGPVGSDWVGYEADMERRRAASRFGLDDDQADRWELAQVGLHFARRATTADEVFADAGEEADKLAALVAWCVEDPDVARALWGHQLPDDDREPLHRLCEAVLDRVEPTNTAGIRWLAARALDLDGRAPESEELLRAICAEQPDSPAAGLVARSLAAFAADRGDARGAVALLRAAGTPAQDELWEEVAGYAGWRPAPTAGRNDPCPCGSGRKYKQCHLGREEMPLSERGPWLYDKAMRFVRDGVGRTLAGEIAREIARATRGGVGLLELLDHPLTIDVVLGEGGVLRAFCDERSALLADDEALTAARWALTGRTVFEVESVRGDRLGLRDVRTGDRVEITNVDPEGPARPGVYLIGRPVPVGDTWRAYSGFLPVGGHLVAEALAVLDRADPFEVASFLGHLLAPPALSNTDGEPLRLHQLTFRLPDPAGAARALAEAFTTDDGIAFRLVRDTVNQADTIVLTARLDGDTLTVEANSDRRADEARALVTRLVPDARPLGHDRYDTDELRELATRQAPQNSDGGPDEATRAAVMAEVVAQFERRWLDEAIPALGGMTPRNAAADPVQRVALDRLLRSFETDDPAAMDARRLRRTLGL